MPALPNFRLLPILLPSLPSLCPAGREMYEVENDIFFRFHISIFVGKTFDIFFTWGSLQLDQMMIILYLTSLSSLWEIHQCQGSSSPFVQVEVDFSSSDFRKCHRLSICFLSLILSGCQTRRLVYSRFSISTLCIEVEEPRVLRSVVDPDEGPIDCTVNPTLTYWKKIDI